MPEASPEAGIGGLSHPPVRQRARLAAMFALASSNLPSLMRSFWATENASRLSGSSRVASRKDSFARDCENHFH